MSRHLPESLFTMVEPTWCYTAQDDWDEKDVGDGDYRSVGMEENEGRSTMSHFCQATPVQE